MSLPAISRRKGSRRSIPAIPAAPIPHEDFDLTFVPALHSSSNMVDGRPVYLGNPCGIVVAARNGKTAYHMGDTDIFSDMALISELYRPQVGFVPIGDRYTMGAKTAALACKRFFNFETVVPCHYGTFPVHRSDGGQVCRGDGRKQGPGARGRGSLRGVRL